jgi:polar amino acid transport system permease protein
MDVVWEGRWLLLSGTLLTVKVFLGGAVLCLFFSLAAGLARLSRLLPVRMLAICYIEIFRGTSLVVQLFWLFFVLPFFGITISAFQAAVLGLGLCFGAYGAEIVRSAISAVPKAQIEAATALNISRLHCMKNIILPQALLIMLPSLGNLLVLLLKATAAASLITLPELTFQASTMNVRTFATIPIFSAVLVIYFALAMVVSNGVAKIEQRAGHWRRKVPT